METEPVNWLLTGEWVRSGILSVGVLVAVVSVRSARATARKKQTADALFSSRNDKELQAGLRCVAKLHDSVDSNIRSFARVEKRESEEVKSMLYVLNHFEFVSVGIKHGIYDENMYRDASHGTIVSLYEKSKPFIDSVRDTRARKTIFQEFERLAERWKKKPLKLTRP